MVDACTGFYDRYESESKATEGAAMIHFRNMASRKKAGSAGNGVQEKSANGKQLAKHKDGPIGICPPSSYLTSSGAVLYVFTPWNVLKTF